MGTTKARRRHFPDEIEQEIQRQMLNGVRRTADISAALRRRFGKSPDLPEPRTIRRRVAELVAAEGTEIWSVRDADPQDVALVLPVLAHLIESSEGRTTLTKHRGEWIARIRRAAPDIPEWQALALSSEYLRAFGPRGDEDLARAADVFLAYAPWRNDQAYVTYLTADEKDWLPGGIRFIAVEDDDGSIFWMSTQKHAKLVVSAQPDDVDFNPEEEDRINEYISRADEIERNIKRRAPYTRPVRGDD